MSDELKSTIRSCITTFLATLLVSIPVTALSGDLEWVGPAVLASLVAAARTLLAIIDPGNKTFGIGSGSVSADVEVEGSDEA